LVFVIWIAFILTLAKNIAMKKIIFCLILVFSFAKTSKAQLTITDSLTNADVANLLTGFGVNISNLVINCDPAAIGEVSGVSMIPLTQGLLLSTGSVNNFNYINLVGGYLNSTFFDPDVSLITTGFAVDMCVLKFDCIPQGDTLQFNFAFGSEEYPTFVGSMYNDAFGILMSGPGINGLQNVAQLPNGDIVSINTVNAGVNSSYFIANPSPTTTGLTYGGFTQNLQVFAETVPGLTYHFKIMITDVSDGALDSGVLLEAFSFRSNVDAVTSLKTESANQFKLYPNPNNGVFTIKNNGFDGQTNKVVVTDITGRIVKDFSMTSSIETIDLSELNSGLYHINIIGAKNVFNEQVLIKK